MPNNKFWQQFFQVMADKFLVLGLILFLWKVHAPWDLIGAASGGLIALCQGSRFRFTQDNNGNTGRQENKNSG